MASYTVAQGEQGVRGKTLVASTADTITFSRGLNEVEVLMHGGTSDLYFTTDGTTPTVAANTCYVLPAGAGALRVSVPYNAEHPTATVVKVISAGTPSYSVTGF